MTEKKPESLADNLGSARKYDANLAKQGQGEGVDFNKLKTKLDDFKKKLLKKFPFTKALGVLPPNAFLMFEEDEAVPKEFAASKPTHLIMLMPEEQYKNLNKIKTEVVKLAKESKENLWVHIKTVEVDLWNYGLDSKFEFLDAIAASFPLHDDGVLGGLRVANIHKTLTLNWLNVGRVRYVATYAVGGSLVRGTAGKDSDVDTFVIIDDTDVKRMSKVELVEKLRGRIVGEFVKEATALAGVGNVLNVQVYLLTDFWQQVKDAHPVMFTFIRDGVPLFDRGTFIPWKRLLQMGKIKPSPEAIDLYMKEGDRTDDIIKRRLLDCMVDIYFGVVTPTQAMMMLAGHPPPIPKTIVQDVKKVLVQKEKLLTLNDVKILEKAVGMYKDYEHGKLKTVPGKEIDEMMKGCNAYCKKMKEVREKLEKSMQVQQAEKVSEETFTLMKKIFGNKSQEALLKDLDKEMVAKGQMPVRMLTIAKDLGSLKQKAKGKKVMTQSEMQKIVRDSSELINYLVEYAQRKELVSLEKGIAQISFGKGKKAEIVAADGKVFVVFQGGEIKKISGKKLVASDKKELGTALSKVKERIQFDLTSEIMDILKKELGKFSVGF